MKFALFLLGSWTEREISAQSRIFGEMLEQAEYAEELGFDSIWIAEHHSSRYGICPSLMPLLSNIAGRTRKIRIGAGVSVLPFHNPILLAEESAMLDVLSNGRLDFGVGRGSADYEYGNFNIDFDTSSSAILNCWVKGFQLDARVIGGEAPVHSHHVPVALVLPGVNFPAQHRLIRNPAVQALPGQHSDFNFSHVQPTPMFGGSESPDVRRYAALP